MRFARILLERLGYAISSIPTSIDRWIGNDEDAKPLCADLAIKALSVFSPRQRPSSALGTALPGNARTVRWSGLRYDDFSIVRTDAHRAIGRRVEARNGCVEVGCQRSPARRIKSEESLVDRSVIRLEELHEMVR